MAVGGRSNADWDIWSSRLRAGVNGARGLSCRCGASAAPLGAEEQVEHLAQRSLPWCRLRQREMVLDDVAIAAPLSFLEYIPSLGEVTDDRERAALGDVERRCEIAQPETGLISNEQQRPAVIREEAPLGHDPNLAFFFRYSAASMSSQVEGAHD